MTMSSEKLAYDEKFERCKKCFVELESLICAWKDGDKEVCKSHYEGTIDFLTSTGFDSKDITSPDYCQRFTTGGNCSFCVGSNFLHACLFICKQMNQVFCYGESTAVTATNLDSISKKEKAPDFLLAIPEKNKLFIILRFVIHQGIVKNFNFGPGYNMKTNTPCSAKHLSFGLRSVIELGESEFFKDVIFSKFVYEMTGGLLQICNDPDTSVRMHVDDLSFYYNFADVTLFKYVKTKDLVKNILTLQGSKQSASPAWLQQACGHMLSKCILQENGVLSVSLSVIQVIDGKLINDDAIASMIAANIISVPPKTIAPTQYCRNIFAQLHQLLDNSSLFANSKSNKESAILCHVIIASFFAFYKRLRKFALKFLFFPLLKPLARCCTTSNENNEERLPLTQSIERLHRLLVFLRHDLQQDFLSNILLPYLPVIFKIFQKSRSSVSFMTSLSRDLISATLSSLSSRDEAVTVLLSLGGACETSSSSTGEMRKVKGNVRFTMDGSDVIVCSDITTAETICGEEDVLQMQDEIIKAIIDIVEHSSQFKTPLLVLLIQQLKELDDDNKNNKQTTTTTLLTDEETRMKEMMKPHLIVCSLITHLCENCNPNDVLDDDVIKMCDVVEVFLSRVIDGDDGEDNLKLIFAIIACCFTAELNQQKMDRLRKLLPYLQTLLQSDTKLKDEENREVCFDISVLISTTLGGAGELDMTKFTRSLQEQLNLVSKQTEQPGKEGDDKKSPTETTKKPLIQEISKPNDDVTTDRMTSLDDAFKSLDDNQPPIRVAALRYLTSLIKKRDPHVIERSVRLFEMIMTSLTVERDSYVYLSAVQCLAQLVLLPDDTMTTEGSRSLYEVLINQMQVLMTSSNDDDVAKEIFIKLGEVLSRVIEHLGEMASHLSRRLLPLLLAGCQHRYSRHIRITCLANMAQLVPLLRHDMTSYQHELTDCLTSMASDGNDVEIRRAAIHVFRTIIERMECDVIEVFPDVIKRWSDLLKDCYEHDVDHVARLHSQLALEGLKKMKKEILLRARHAPLSKKIVVRPTL